MNNIRLTIAYDGTKYAGWQIQENAKTIQGEIEKVLKKILKETIRLTGSGRTDSGVHARGQVANFITKKNMLPKKLKKALNVNLPKDIVIKKAENVPLEFHSRFNAKNKHYRYTILNGRTDDPFTRRYYYKAPYKLNFELMKQEAAGLVGRHDFKAFQSKSALSKIRNTTRMIKMLTIKNENDFIFIDIEADGFLYNMVRNIAGTLMEIGRGYFPPGSIKRILKSKDRRAAGPTASAKGLALIEVAY